MNKQEVELLSREIEMLMNERARMLKVVGAAAVLVANADASKLQPNAVAAAELLSEMLNELPEETLKARTPPSAVIERVVADGRAIDASGQLELPPGSGKLELRYGAIRLSSQERVRFRYKLEGFDPEWTEL